MPNSVIVKGFEQLQEASRKLVYAMNPAGPMGQANRYATLQLMRAVRVRTHVDTGTYRSSIQADFSGIAGRVYVASNRNPQSGQSASIYGAFEEARGGSHAAFAQAAASVDAKNAVQDGIDIIISGLP